MVWKLFGYGSQFGVELSYEVQSSDGLTHSFINGKEFNCNDNEAIILGTNIFYGN